MTNLISLFAGAGGMDLGFHKAGFTTEWANEFDKKITPSYRHNFPDVTLDDRSLFDIPSIDMPDDIDGLIGGPPCQSWSIGGSNRGFEDKRGQVLLEYIRVIEDKQPKFFVAENVKGMFAKNHKEALEIIIDKFSSLGYDFSYKLLNSADYGVPQTRERVFFVGYRKDLDKKFTFPEPFPQKVSLKNAIWDLKDNAISAVDKTKANDPSMLALLNHEYSTDGFSSMYMSRNRRRAWDEQSFTIQAGGRQAPLHPGSPPMRKTDTDKFIFGENGISRRLSVREAARIQTFPDTYEMLYNDVNVGYKLMGNAVPVDFAYAIAQNIRKDLY